MGRKKEADSIKAQADAQNRIAQSQEDFGNKYFAQADKNQARQDEIYGQISPFATDLLANDPYAGVARPDMSELYRRNYADQTAGIEADTARSVGDVGDYQVGSGAARTGSAGTGGLGAVFRGRDLATTAARRDLQTDLSNEKLAGYEDTMQRKGLGLAAKMQGANILQGQQAVYDPYKATAVGAGGLAGGAGTRSAAAGTYERSANLPGKYSWLGGLAGAALGVGASAVAPGGIWNRARAVA